MTEPIRWEDYTGRVRWQPRCGEDVSAYREYTHDRPWPHRNTSRPPVLYRWRWIAKMVGERERRRRSHQFREVRRDL